MSDTPIMEATKEFAYQEGRRDEREKIISFLNRSTAYHWIDTEHPQNRRIATVVVRAIANALNRGEHNQ